MSVDELHEGWHKAAACAGAEPELFFPFPSQASRIEQAKAICTECPVRAECLNEALARGLDHGVFGGLTADERRGLRRREVAA